MRDTRFEDLDRRKLFGKGRSEKATYRCIHVICDKCHGHGIREGSTPNRNSPGKAFVRDKPCEECGQKGFLEVWNPDHMTVFCTNDNCPMRYSTKIYVKDVIKGLQGFTRSSKVDHINYNQDRRCPYCQGRLKPKEKPNFVKWYYRGKKWVSYWASNRRKNIKIRRV